MRKPNIFLGVGLLLVAATLTVERLPRHVPGLIIGLGFGLGIVFELLGVLSARRDRSRSRHEKPSFFKRG